MAARQADRRDRLSHAARRMRQTGATPRAPGKSASKPSETAFLPAGIQHGPGEAFFQFETILGDRFVFKLADAERIRQAREILEKKLPKRVIGQIVAEPQPYNRPWHFHLDPRTVTFAYLTDESCDGAIHYVEDHLSDVGERILPQNRWCPASSRLMRELFPADSSR
jgi:hypothetical protein